MESIALHFTGSPTDQEAVVTMVMTHLLGTWTGPAYLIAAYVLVCSGVCITVHILDRREHPRHRGLRCSIEEEWCGVFIGRRYCRVHEIRWDGGGYCPQRGEPLRQGRQ